MPSDYTTCRGSKLWALVGLRPSWSRSCVTSATCHTTFATVESLEPLAIGATVILFLLDRFSMAYKWNILQRARDADFDIGLHSASLSHRVFSRLRDTTSVGGDVFRAARRLLGPLVSKVSATIVLEFVLGLLAILSLSAMH